jgi:beta-glucanase (GH16 family)
MRRWKLALAVAVALGVAIWGVGLRSNHVQPSGLGLTRARLPSFAKLAHEASLKGTMTPAGTPEFSATFTGHQLDTAIWSTCYPWMDRPSGCTNLGNNTEEQQWYLPSQVRVSGGDLALTAEQIPTPGVDASGQPREYPCRSGMATTYPGFKFEYGFVQVEAWIPTAPGLWPAVWLAAANLNWPPEIDMLESFSGSSAAHSAVYFHSAVGNQLSAQTMSPMITQGWHTISLSWTESQLTYYIDGKVLMTVHQGVPQQPMYLIADLAEWLPAATPAYCNGQLLIRSVKVWKL